VLLYLLLSERHPCGVITLPAELLKNIVEVGPPPPA